MSTILITHDLGLAAAYCDRVVVMEKGRVVETALSANIFASPAHPYTRKLMRATPRLGVSLRDLLPEEEATLSSTTSPRLRGEVVIRAYARITGEGQRSQPARPRRTIEMMPLTPALSPQAGRGRPVCLSLPDTILASPVTDPRSVSCAGKGGLVSVGLRLLQSSLGPPG